MGPSIEAPGSPPAYATATAEGLRLALKVTPGARKTALRGPAPEAGGGTVLGLAVTAPPEGGKANAAVIALLARQLGVAKSQVEIRAGTGDRRKTVLIRGDPAALSERLAAWTTK